MKEIIGSFRNLFATIISILGAVFCFGLVIPIVKTMWTGHDFSDNIFYSTSLQNSVFNSFSLWYVLAIFAVVVAALYVFIIPFIKDYLSGSDDEDIFR